MQIFKGFFLDIILRLHRRAIRYDKTAMLTKARRSQNVSIEGELKLGDYSTLEIRGNPSKFLIGNGVSCRRFCSFLIFPNSTCIIHDNVFFNNHCSVNCLDRIEIGENTIFGESVKIYDHNHQYSRGEQLMVERDKFKTAPISIGKNCWIGSNVTILKGVTIGDNVIIGANCLIHKSIKSDSVVMNAGQLVIQSKE